MPERLYTLVNGNELIVTDKSTLFIRVANESTVFAAHPDTVFGEVLKLIDIQNAKMEELKIKNEILSSENVESLLLLEKSESESIILAEELLRLKNLEYESCNSLEQVRLYLSLVD